MCSVCPASHFRSSVHLNVFHNQSIHIQSFVVGIRFSISKQLQQEFSAFLRPAALCATELFALRFPADSAIVSTEWNNFFLRNYVLQITLRSSQTHALNGLSCFACVLLVVDQISQTEHNIKGLHLNTYLEMDTQIRSTSFARFGTISFGRIFSHFDDLQGVRNGKKIRSQRRKPTDRSKRRETRIRINGIRFRQMVGYFIRIVSSLGAYFTGKHKIRFILFKKELIETQSV